MSKITLTNLANLQNENTAVSAINANNAVLTTAFDNTLSRDGTVPNTMGANLDMNANQILNLPAPATVNSPARLIDVTSPATIASVPPVGTSGAVVGLLNANKTDSGNNTFTGTNTFSGTTNLTLQANTVANSMLATAPANTLKGNITGGVANVTDNTKANIISWLNPVTSIAGNAGDFTLTGGVTNTANAIKLSLTNATFQSAAQNPASTTSGVGVMMGLGSTCKLTPTYSGRILVLFGGNVANTVLGNSITYQLRFGTGAAPANGAALTGTFISGGTTSAPGASFAANFNLFGIATGLTPGTQYWFDTTLSAGANTSTMSGVYCTLIEF